MWRKVKQEKEETASKPLSSKRRKRKQGYASESMGKQGKPRASTRELRSLALLARFARPTQLKNQAQQATFNKNIPQQLKVTKNNKNNQKLTKNIKKKTSKQPKNYGKQLK